jgi:hypothetical protein
MADKPKNDFGYNHNFDYIGAIRRALAADGDDGKDIRDSVFRWLDKMSAEQREAANNQLAIKWLEWKAGATLRYVRGLVSEYKGALPKR